MVQSGVENVVFGSKIKLQPRNPFIEVTNTELASASDNEESSKRSLGAALYELLQPKQKEMSLKKSETKKNSSKDLKPAND